MLDTIWMCTQEWSLITIRTTALTFATCHHALSCVSAFARSITLRSLRFARVGTVIRISRTACDGVSRVLAQRLLGDRAGDVLNGWGSEIVGIVAGSTRPSYDSGRMAFCRQAIRR